MTSNLIACCTGAVVAAMQVATAATSSNALDSIPTLGGVGLLVWIVIYQTKECDKLREQLRKAHEKCSNCRLARAANDTLIEAGKEHFDERENQADTEKGGRNA
ncbi:MAG: hypothetical protein IKZ07_03785 [Akkermansia sp.]|nr:hypothetical protein [Akkermansia sp.]